MLKCPDIWFEVLFLLHLQWVLCYRCDVLTER